MAAPAITFRTTDTGRWGAGKGSNLTAAEIDINLWNLAQAIVALQENPPTANNISAITVSGMYMTITLTDGSTIGPLALPVLQWRWRGEWVASTAYAALDGFIVTSQGLYTVNADHTSAATFDEGAVDSNGNALYNKLFGFSGLSGATLADLTDVALSSPTGADVLVYDGSAAKWRNQRPKYVIGVYAPGVLTAGQVILYHRFTKAVTVPANFGAYLGHSSQAGGSAAATSSTVIGVSKALAASPNSFTSAGTITIAAGTVTPTFASASGLAVSFAQGDVLQLTGTATPDPTFADFYATLVGYET